jgi:hypothetical protein
MVAFMPAKVTGKGGQKYDRQVFILQALSDSANRQLKASTFLRAGRNSERCIQRAKANSGGQQKDSAEYDENGSGESGNGSRKIKRCKDDGQNHPDQAVCVSHVLIHKVKILIGNWGFVELGNWRIKGGEAK